jgi:hypothetical protein
VTSETSSERDVFDADGVAATERSDVTQTLGQLVCGPISNSATPPLFELQGALSREVNYAHHGVEALQNFGSVCVKWAADADAVRYDARSHAFPHKDKDAAPKDTGKARLAHAGELAPRRPPWLVRLHDLGDDVAVDAEIADAEIAESFALSSAREHLHEIFEAELFPREAGDFSAAVAKALARFYHAPSQAQLRDSAPLPSVLAVQAVANKWDAEGARLADGAASLSAERKVPRRSSIGTSDTRRVSLAFLDAESFEIFVAECFQVSRGIMLHSLGGSLNAPDADG